ncbi:hypothetical protein [Amycolatopsis sp. NPDC059657]|uniref:hypothetical protein n=1 Tax=Amycolatopsis sp. NPDC059657 TaxID=3346899 RepID=UPI00366AB1C9
MNPTPETGDLDDLSLDGLPPLPPRPDENGDESRRTCGYRRCGAVLPQVSGRGNRARFCQDGKSWGTRNLTCRDAEAALVDVDSLREGPVALDSVSVEALGAQVTRAVEPARELVEALAGIERQLRTTVAEALAARDSADADATEQRRLRGIAEAAAAEARDKADDASRLSQAAVRDRENQKRLRAQEERSRIEAEQAQLRAEGATAAMQDELARATARAEAAVGQVAELDRTLAATVAELAAARGSLEETKGALGEQRARAEAAEERGEASAREAAKLREQAEAAEANRRQELSEAHVAAEQARAETERVRVQAEEVRGRLEQEVRATRTVQEGALAELRASINSLNRDLGAAEHARQLAEERAEAAGTRFAVVRDLVAEHDGELSETVRELLRGALAP